MPPDEYTKAWNQRQLDLAAGLIAKRVVPTKAEHAKAYRDRQRAKLGKPAPTLAERRDWSDKAVEAAIATRGKILTEMMRTPACMWQPDWLKD